MSRPDHVLVLRAPTLLLNPAFDRTVIATEEQADPENAAAEYHAEWRKSGAGLVWASTLDAVIDVGVTARAPTPPFDDDHYVLAVDLASGLGTGKDSAAASIGHVEATDAGADIFVQDLLLEYLPPFDAPSVCADIARASRPFGVSEVVGDGFARGFVAPEFARHGLTYIDAPKTASECYILALAALTSKRVRLLDHPKARRQWLSLQRHYRSGGHVKVDHPAGGDDDLANTTALATVVALGLDEPEPRVRARFR